MTTIDSTVTSYLEYFSVRVAYCNRVQSISVRHLGYPQWLFAPVSRFNGATWKCEVRRGRDLLVYTQTFIHHHTLILATKFAHSPLTFSWPRQIAGEPWEIKLFIADSSAHRTKTETGLAPSPTLQTIWRLYYQDRLVPGSSLGAIITKKE